MYIAKRSEKPQSHLISDNLQIVYTTNKHSARSTPYFQYCVNYAEKKVPWLEKEDAGGVRPLIPSIAVLEPISKN